jgi:hypothetical protein
LIIENVTTTGNGLFGVAADFAEGKIVARQVIATNNGSSGFAARRVIARDVTATNNGAAGIQGESVVAKGTTANGNFFDGVFASRVVKGRDLTATGNLGYGVTSVRIALRDSTITGNDGFPGAMDLASLKRPRVKDSDCGRSVMFLSAGGGPWGVCTLD